MNLQITLFITLLTSIYSCIGAPGSGDPQPKTDEALFQSMESNKQWPSYRGFLASGYMHEAALPDSFNVETSFNVKWNIPVPGLGLSCPVIWDDHVFITTAISETDDQGYLKGIYGDIEPVQDSSEHAWMVYCIDRSTGDIVWEDEAFRGIPSNKRHPKSSHANTTIATDGSHVVAFFGTEGLYCYNMEGTLLWKRDFGLIKAAWHVVESAEFEFCSSPVIFDNRLIIQADALNTAFVEVLNLADGETVWRVERDEIPGWCTPNVYLEGTDARVVVNGYKRRAAYDLETGEEIWWMSGGGDVPIPTPVVWKDLIYFNSAHGRHRPLFAVRNSARGEIPYPKKESDPGSQIEWFYDREGAYMTSPVVYDSLLYQLRWNGSLSCYHARSGEILYAETVKPTSFIACPVVADGKIYMVSEEGDLFIAATGNKYRLLKKIPLGETSLATPGIVPGMLILRTANRLIAVSED